VNQLLEALAALFRGSLPWVVVLAWERAVRVRLGKHVRMLEPGIHWRIPYVDEVRALNTRLRVTSFPCSTVSTRDGHAVTVAGNIGFRIADPLVALLAMSDPDVVLQAFGQSVVAEIISRAPKADQLTVSDVEERALASIEEFAATRGLHVEFFRLVDFAMVRAFRLLQEQWRPSSRTDACH